MSTPTQEQPVGALADRPFAQSALALCSPGEAPVKSVTKSAPLRISALVVTLAVDACALVVPTHELGDTAVYGRAYLWGESSSRVNCGTRLCWFVDGLEYAQHALLSLALLTGALALFVPRVRARISLALTLALFALAAVRAAKGAGVALGFYWLGAFAVACAGALALIERTRAVDPPTSDSTSA